MGDIAGGMPRTNVALDYLQVEYQSTMIECEGMITNQHVYVLFDPVTSSQGA